MDRMTDLAKGQTWVDPGGYWETCKIVDFGPDWILVSDLRGCHLHHVTPEQRLAMTHIDGHGAGEHA